MTRPAALANVNANKAGALSTTFLRPQATAEHVSKTGQQTQARDTFRHTYLDPRHVQTAGDVLVAVGGVLLWRDTGRVMGLGGALAAGRSLGMADRTPCRL